MQVATATPLQRPALQARHRLDAESIGCRVDRDVRDGHLEAIFKNACNVRMKDGRMVAMLADVSGNVAHGIRVRGELASNLRLSIGMPTRFGVERLTIGDVLEVTLSRARLWQPALRIGTYCRDGSSDAAALFVRQLLYQHARESGQRSGHSEFLAHTLGMCDTPTILGRRISQALIQLEFAGRSRSQIDLLTAISPLIGLGPGLTPAGDDFLIGWLAGLSLVADTVAKVRFLKAVCAVINGLRAKTTSISAQHLDDACALMFSERLSDLCVAIALGSPERVLAAKLSAQLAVGATSGADAAAGLMFAVFDCDVRADDLRGRM
jgi:Protein of unknown function (DUF2877)